MAHGHPTVAPKLTTLLKPEQLLLLMDIRNKKSKTPLDILEEPCPSYNPDLNMKRRLMAGILQKSISVEIEQGLAVPGTGKLNIDISKYIES